MVKKLKGTGPSYLGRNSSLLVILSLSCSLVMMRTSAVSPVLECLYTTTSCFDSLMFLGGLR